jgi:prepilin-type N-terminal cleavage/methylation domain-containing protein
MFDLGQHHRRHRSRSTGVMSFSLRTTDRGLRTRRAFTLVELLIVLAIIGVVVALGIPLFGVLTGARSVEAGRNVVAATIGQARTVAVNEGKYAGVLFYVDPATERTAMAIVVVTDPSSSLEDPDPYDKYKTYVDRTFSYPGFGGVAVTPVTTEQEYFSSQNDALNNGIRLRGDRVIAITHDADNAYRSPLYANNPLVSEYLHYFGNYRPTVRAFECRKTYTTSNTPTVQPPQNGPYGTWAGSPTTPTYFTQYRPSTGTPVGAAISQKRSTQGPFANVYWGAQNESPIVRYSSSEQTLLPRGVAVQVMTQPLIRAGTLSPNNFQERYLRTGIIMFDPQGRLTVLKNFTLRQADPANPLGDYLGLTAVARNIPAGVGIAVYDSQKFTTAQLPNGEKTSQADWLYQAPSSGAGNEYLLTSNFTNIFGDYPTPAAAQSESDEEQWLDTNATPLIINRYTGSLSEAE